MPAPCVLWCGHGVINLRSSALVLAGGIPADGRCARRSNCTCRAEGRNYEIGTLMCIRGRLSQCLMNQNNPSWLPISDTCASASLPARVVALSPHRRPWLVRRPSPRPMIAGAASARDNRAGDFDYYVLASRGRRAIARRKRAAMTISNARRDGASHSCCTGVAAVRQGMAGELPDQRDLGAGGRGPGRCSQLRRRAAS